MYEDIVTIGILEESNKRNTFKLLKGLLVNMSFRIIYENKNKKENIIVLNQDKKIIIILDINPNIINSIDYIGIDFTLLIHTFIKVDDNKSSLKNIFQRTKNIIINCDEDKWINLLEENKKSIVITYGFNNKATINPSSYNIDDLINANICFQREMLTLYGEKIDPFEIPITINSIQKQDLYSAMGVLAGVLILGLNNVIGEELVEFEIEKEIKVL